MSSIQIYISVNQLENTGVVLEYLLEKIKRSSLKDQKIILCHSKDWKKVKSDLNIEYFNTQTDYTSYEYPALAKIWNDSKQQEDFYGLYLHCKGSSKIVQRDLDNGIAWADYMLYGLLTHSDRCLKYLNDDVDLVGSLWHWHYKGNFYWFNSKYIKKLQDPYSLNTTTRFDAEYWCATPLWFNQSFIPKVKNLFYIPDLKHDDQFLELKQEKYLPNLNDQYVLNYSFEQFLKNKWYGVFDKIVISSKEYEQFRTELHKFLNYDGTIEIT